MFESAELGHKVDKETYDAEVPALREALLAAQYDLLQNARFPVIILIGGVDGAGSITASAVPLISAAQPSKAWRKLSRRLALRGG